MDGTGRRNEALSSEVIEVDKVEVTSRADLPCLNFDGSTEAGLFGRSMFQKQLHVSMEEGRCLRSRIESDISLPSFAGPGCGRDVVAVYGSGSG